MALGSLSALGGVVALVRSTGYDVDPRAAGRLSSLTPAQYVLVQHLARRICAPDRPDDRTIPTPDELEVAEYVDGYLVGMRPAVRRDLQRLFSYVEQVAPLGCGYARRFTSLGPAEQDAVLRSLESSRIGLLRAGFDGLRSLVMMGYWRDPRTWRIAAYPGPFIDRPDAGFW